MRSIAPLLSGLVLFAWCATPKSVSAAPGKRKGHPAGKVAAENDDPLQKQLEWENKVLGPSNEKKIDHAKIQKLQAEEMARREKQEKLENERKEREAALAAQRKDVKQPSTREVPTIEETATAPVPPKPVEKHDDAFVDKLLKSDRALPKKKASTGPDEVDELLSKAKEEKKPGRKSKSDGVDQILASADKQAPVVTSGPKPAAEVADPVSAEAAAREAALKAVAAAKAQDERDKGRKKPIVPDAAMLRAQAVAPVREQRPSMVTRPARSEWTDPFEADSGSASRSRTKTATGDLTPAAASTRMTAPSSTSGRRSPAAARPPVDRSPDRSFDNNGWHDPFEAGTPAKRPAAKPAKPAGKSRAPNWKDPFA